MARNYAKQSVAVAIASPPRMLMHPVIQVGEASSAYMKRIAISNGISLERLYRLGVVLDEQVLEKALSWDRVAPPNESRQYLTSLINLRRSTPRAWLIKTARCCPLCLREQGTWAAEWELRPYLACAKHRCWLIDRCGTCEKPIVWTRKSLLCCDCGDKFTDVQVATAPTKFVELSLLIASKLPNFRGEHSAFDGLSLSDMISLVGYLENGVDANKRSSRRGVGHIRDLSNAIAILEPSADALSAWPSGFRTYLSKMHKERGDEDGCVGSTFRGIYLYIRSNQNRSGFGFLRDCFLQYLVDHWPWPSLDRKNSLVDTVASRLPWMWASRAARELNMKEEKLKELAGKGLIEVKYRPSRSQRMLLAVRREDLPRIRQILHEQAGLKALRNLGISMRRQIVLLPLLFPEAQGDTVQFHKGEHVQVLRSSIEKLLKLAEDLPVIDYEGAGQVALARVLRSCAWRNEMIERLFRMILRGEMKPEAVLKGKPGFTGWLFSREALERTKLEGSLTRLKAYSQAGANALPAPAPPSRTISTPS
ncbi:TniQ family protein [Burkholderia cepacia]|uniref:TniQ family protein n=1 Tax=Burkholderia cepacia TaxID=292 RepID=UPI00398F09A3